jgi:hypothetical protein
LEVFDLIELLVGLLNSFVEAGGFVPEMPVMIYPGCEQVVAFICQSEVDPFLEWLVRAEEPFLGS